VVSLFTCLFRPEPKIGDTTSYTGRPLCLFSRESESSVWQTWIKEFVGPRNFSSLDPFGESRSIVGTTVYSRLSGLGGGGIHESLRNTDNPNFIFYTPTAPLARHKLRNVLLSRIYHFTGRIIYQVWLLIKLCFWSLIFYFVLNFSIFLLLYVYLLSLSFLRRPWNCRRS
jgi:hypothetical protein